MAVRFLPTSGEPPEPAPERRDLAEVIDLRTRLLERTDAVGRADSHARPGAVAELISATNSLMAEGRDPGGRLEAVRTASEDGVRLLARKARSSGELRRELLALGHDANEVDAVILDFESGLYLDDLGLARVVAESLRERKRASRMQIRVKLRERLLPDGIIEEVLADLDDETEQDLLRTAAEDRARRLTGLDRGVAERRLLGFLARRGWVGERAVRVTREALDAAAARGAVRFR